MTKQHYIALAAALKRRMPIWIENYNSSPKERELYNHAYRQWRDCVIAVAEVCASFDSKFSKGKFYQSVRLAKHSRQVTGADARPHLSLSGVTRGEKAIG